MLFKWQDYWNNLQIRGLLYSVLIHLFFLALYFVLTYSGQTVTYDFGVESGSSSTQQPQTQKKKHKKVNISRVVMPKKPTPKTLSENGQPVAPQDQENTDNQDAQDIADAEDMSFHPGATAPHMAGFLRPDYPKSAKQLNVNAKVYVSIVINRDGKVIKVKVTRVVLSKQLPPGTETALKKSFGRSITRALSKVRFSRPYIQGKNIPIEMEQVVDYTLEN